VALLKWWAYSRLDRFQLTRPAAIFIKMFMNTRSTIQRRLDSIIK